MTYESISNLISNSTVIEILKIIRASKEIRPSELIEEMDIKFGCSSSTVYRLLSNLSIDNVITISKHSNKRTYYSLNGEYFDRASIVMNDFFMYFKL